MDGTERGAYMKRNATPRRTKHAREILGEFYPTAKALRKRCQEILDQYRQTTAAPDVLLSGEHAAFFVELLQPEGAVSAAYKSTRDGQLGRHLRFVYEDGLSDLVSWNNACGSPPKQAAEASNAMRWESSKLSVDVACKFFSAPWPWLCQKSGVYVSQAGGFEGERYEVHHDGKEWSCIRDEWLEAEGITLEQVPIEPQFGGGGYQMQPGALRSSWVRFHAEHAKLVVVSLSWHKQHHGNCKSKKGKEV